MDNDIKEVIRIQNRLQRKLSDTRYAHTVSVSHTCACLAMKYEYDVNKYIYEDLIIEEIISGGKLYEKR